ncbi:LOW QUALITY PROTEIN: inhibitor of growth protein 2 [Corvus hawaiiensis]|uniref:LOW QUALITY PROTEIN: inhibitor of growth protein 2 n=1 Tax=Corvus hawaiiensis TaxID=134902 RepID=UPI002018D0B9|nr:LOW QUALITY PROTEIN: inhibitor of growth protein 2 [Corvus hawaiiensis]
MGVRARGRRENANPWQRRRPRLIRAGPRACALPAGAGAPSGGFAPAAAPREGVRDPRDPAEGRPYPSGLAWPGPARQALTVPRVRPPEGKGAAAGGGEEEGSGAAAGTPRPVRAARRQRRMCCWRGGMMLAGPQLVAGPAAPGGERARLLSLYVQDYLECVESLPLDIQRNASLLREMDTQCQEALKEIDDVYEKYKSENDPVQKKRLQQHLQRALINSQELGDEKIQIVTQMLELVENRARQMETHSQCFQDLSENEKPLEKAKMESCQPERSSRRPRRQRTSESRDLCHIANGIDDCDDQPPKEKRSKSSKKKKRSKAKQEREVSPVEFAIDPNEPTYCLCNQVSYGEMIGCDNEQCPIEWFHFSCVGLTYKPKGKWYCPKCRGDNEKTMDKCTDKSKKDRRSR